MELDWSKAPYNWSLNFVQWPSKKEEAEAVKAQVAANAARLTELEVLEKELLLQGTP